MYATLADLHTAISTELVRVGDSAVTARLPEFVKLAEARIFNGDETIGAAPVRCREMETRATLTFTDGVSATPANFLEARRMTWNGAIPSRLKYTEPDAFYSSVYVATPQASGYPLLFTIEGTIVDILPRASGTASMSYYAKPAALTLPGDTNTVLSTHGQLYLFSALIDGYSWLRNTPKRDESVMRYQGALAGVNHAAARARYAGVPLSPRIPGAR